MNYWHGQKQNATTGVTIDSLLSALANIPPVAKVSFIIFAEDLKLLPEAPPHSPSMISPIPSFNGVSVARCGKYLISEGHELYRRAREAGPDDLHLIETIIDLHNFERLG